MREKLDLIADEMFSACEIELKESTFENFTARIRRRIAKKI